MSAPNKTNEIVLQLRFKSKHDYGYDPTELIECIKENVLFELDVEMDRFDTIEDPEWSDESDIQTEQEDDDDD